MKKLVLTALLTMALSVSAFADSSDSVNVVVHGKPVQQSGVIIDNRTMIPVRGVMEELGFVVDWNAETKTATLNNGETFITMTAGEKSFIAGDKVVVPDVPQTIVDGRFMLPLRAVCDAVGGIGVDWDNETKTAFIIEPVDEEKDESTLNTSISGVTIEIEPIDETDLTKEDGVNEIVIE